MDSFKLKNFVLSKEAKHPIVFDGLINNWPAAAWTPQSLSENLKHKTVRFRIGQKQNKEIQWETGCQYKEATMKDFADWLLDDCNSSNPLAEYPRTSHWCYADYKYMTQTFTDKPHILKAVDWGVFGFDGRDGSESTWWLGSEGAYTVCHYDTYGCNLVAQIYGRKEWTLFPPDATSAMYPTRIPYEESSVFSQVNIQNPDHAKHPRFKETTAYKVILEPGQVLFVPRQWWHHVSSLETSISINSWIELDSDKEVHLEEAVTRFLTFSLLSQNNSSQDPDNKIWLNPTEEVTSTVQHVQYINQALQLLHPEPESTPVSESPSTSSDNSNDSKHKAVSGEETDKVTTSLDIDSIPDLTSAPRKHKTIQGSTEPVRKAPRIKSSDEELESQTSIHKNTGDSHKTTPEDPNYIIINEDFDREHIRRIKPCEKLVVADMTSKINIASKLDAIDIANEILQPNVIELICENIQNKVYI